MWVNTVNRWEGPIDFDQNHKILHEKHIFSTAREILQFVGTEVCRVCFQDDFHVKVVFDAIRRNKHEKVVISDARFPNERNYIKNAGGFNFKTVDVNATQSKGTHASETSLGIDADYDYVFSNDKTKPMQRLITQVEQAIKYLKLDEL